MEPFENELHQALRRTEPPEGFTERVLARVGQQPAAPVVLPLRRPSQTWSRKVWALAAAVGLVGGLALVEQEHQRRTRTQALEARQQLLQALQIAGSKLDLTVHKVKEFHEE